MKHDTNMWPWQSCKLDQYWDFLSFGKVVVQRNRQTGETNQVWGNHCLLSFKENEGEIRIIFLKKKWSTNPIIL